jgi:mannosyltransferase
MLFVDGIIFTLQRAGGISAIFRSLLNYLDHQNVVTNHFLDGQSLQELDQCLDPAREEGAVKTTERTPRALERYRSCKMEMPRAKSSSSSSSNLNNPSSDIYHSSYYRTPTDKSVTSVLTVYDFMYERYRKGPARWVHTLQKNAAIKRAQSIICISQTTLEDLVEFAGLRPDQTVSVVYPGVSESFKPILVGQDSSEPAARPFILFVGLRGGYKNFKLALQTLTELPEFELRCVGGGGFSGFEFEGFPEHVVSRVRHMGFTTDEELNGLYNEAACLFYPSRYEGFGIPVLEAMKAGCPVVSINCKSIVEIGGAALQMVPLEDPTLLAKAVMRTLSSQRGDIVNMGRFNAINFSWDKSNFETLQVYKKLGLR